VGRLQAATGTAVDTLLAVAKGGAKDGDRVRAAVALLDHAFRGTELGDALRPERDPDPAPRPVQETADVVRILAGQLQRLGSAEMGEAERSRLTATLADALLRAFAQDTLAARLEALTNILQARKLENQK
jgi:hypothetical protein